MGLLALLACLLAACSSTSSHPFTSAVEDAGGTAEPDAMTGTKSTADAGGVQEAPDAAVCASLGKLQCQTCCVNLYPGGGETYALAEQDCLCVGESSCVSVCDFQDCIDLSSNDPTCADCFAQHKDSCDRQAANACAGDPTCTTYSACVEACRP